MLQATALLRVRPILSAIRLCQPGPKESPWLLLEGRASLLLLPHPGCQVGTRVGFLYAPLDMIHSACLMYISRDPSAGGEDAPQELLTRRQRVQLARHLEERLPIQEVPRAACCR